MMLIGRALGEKTGAPKGKTSMRSYEELFAVIYKETYGKPLTAEELDALMAEALEYFEAFGDAFEEAHGHRAPTQEDLNAWLDSNMAQEKVRDITLH
jgi:hypothetical protein